MGSVGSSSETPHKIRCFGSQYTMKYFDLKMGAGDLRNSCIRIAYKPRT
jgi:hypothetical protein